MADVLTFSDELSCNSGEESSVDLWDTDDVLNDDGIIRDYQFEPRTEDTGGDDDETGDERRPTQQNCARNGWGSQIVPIFFY